MSTFDNPFRSTLLASPLVCTGRLLDLTDTGKYGEISVAYSVRKTRTAYQGFCMRVRRTSDNTEKDIGFVQTDLDLPTLLTFASQFDCYVSVWYDQSGQNRHAYQNTWAFQPQIVKQGKVIVDTFSKQIAVEFNGGYMVSTWTPTVEDVEKCGMMVTAATGIPTIINGNVELVSKQTGTLNIYDQSASLGSDLVTTDYPNPLLEEGYDTFLFETIPVNDSGSKIWYVESGEYRQIEVTDTSSGQITKTDTNIGLVGGPASVSVDAIDPKDVDGTTNIYPEGTEIADKEYSDLIKNETDELLYGIPWNSEYVTVVDDEGSPEAATSVRIGSSLGGVDEKYWTGISWNGGTNNGIYCSPYDASQVLFIPPDKGAPQVIGTSYSGAAKWRGMVKTSTAIYCIPYNATRVLKIDPATQQTSLLEDTVADRELVGDGTFQDGVLSGTNIICPPYNAGSVLVIDTMNDTTELYGSIGVNVQLRPGPDYEVHAFTLDGGRGYTGSSINFSTTAPAYTGGTPVTGTASVSITSIVTQIDLATYRDTTDDGILAGYNAVEFENAGGFGYIEQPIVEIYTIGYDNRWNRDWRWQNRLPTAFCEMEDDIYGTLKVKQIVVSDGGDGLYTGRTPFIKIVGGKGVTARARAIISDQGVILGIQIPEGEGGSGYWDLEHLKVVIEGGNSGEGAELALAKVTALTPLERDAEGIIIGGGAILEVQVTDGGAGYNKNRPPQIRFVGGKGVGAKVSKDTDVTIQQDGKITGITIGSGADAGTKYVAEVDTADASTLTAFYDTFRSEISNSLPRTQKIRVDPPSVNGGNPAGWAGEPAEACVAISAVSAEGAITGVVVIHTGSGYIQTPQVTVQPPTDQTGTQAQNFSATMELDGRVTNTQITSTGTKYLTEPAVTFDDRSNEAATPGPGANARCYLEGETEDPTRDPGYVYDPRYRYRYNPRMSTGTGKFTGAFLSKNGSQVISLPYNTHRLLIINTDPTKNFAPEDVMLDTVVEAEGGDGSFGIQLAKFSAGVFDAAGDYLYAIPYNYKQVARIDAQQFTVELLTRDGATKPTMFQGQWNSGILAVNQNKIYGVPASGNSLLVIDANLPSQSEVKFFSNIRGKGNKFSAAAVSKSNIIYFINYQATVVAELNPGESLRSASLPAAGIVLASREAIVFPPKTTGENETTITVIDLIVDPPVKRTKVLTYAINTSYGDGAEVEPGVVVFIPIYNITDTFTYQGKLAVVDVSAGISDSSTWVIQKSTFELPIEKTVPYPSRTAIKFPETNKVSWIPRETNAATIRWDYTDLEDSGRPELDLTETHGIRLDEQTLVAWGSNVLLPSGTETAGTVPTDIVVREIKGDDLPGVERTGNQGWQISVGVVDSYGRIVLLPGFEARFQNINTDGASVDVVQIFYPGFSTKAYPEEFNPAVRDLTFPIKNSDSFNDPQLSYPTAIYFSSGFFDGTAGIKYGGGALGLDERVYGVPFNHPRVLAVDTTYYMLEEYGDFTEYTDSASTQTSENETGAIVRGTELYRGCVAGKNGKLYGIPYSANHILEINPLESNPSLKVSLIPETVSSVTGEPNTAGKWYGGCMAQNGKIYTTPWNANYIMVITPGEGTSPTTWTTVSTGEGGATLPTSGSKWKDGALGSDGCIYCAPWNSTFILKIIPSDPDLGRMTDSFDFIDTNLENLGDNYGGVAAGLNDLIYFSPSRQRSVIQFDPSSQTFDLLGDFFYTNPPQNSKWTSGMVTTPSGGLYAFPSVVASFLEILPDRKYMFRFNNDDGFHQKGVDTTKEFKLRPYVLSDNTTVLFHTDGQYGMYNVDPETVAIANQLNVPLLLGPVMENGVTTLIQPEGTFVSVREGNVTVVTPFIGGITGAVSRNKGSDLNMIVDRVNLDINIGDASSTSKVIFNTIYGESKLGVFSGFADGTQIHNLIRNIPLLTTPYTVDTSDTIDGNYGLGTVSGVRVNQIPEFRTIFSGKISETIVFGNTNQVGESVRYGEDQSFYFLDSTNLYISSENSTIL